MDKLSHLPLPKLNPASRLYVETEETKFKNLEPVQLDSAQLGQLESLAAFEPAVLKQMPALKNLKEAQEHERTAVKENQSALALTKQSYPLAIGNLVGMLGAAGVLIFSALSGSAEFAQAGAAAVTAIPLVLGGAKHLLDSKKQAHLDRAKFAESKVSELKNDQVVSHGFVTQLGPEGPRLYVEQRDDELPPQVWQLADKRAPG